MASELSKLIEDQLQKHDEEAPLSPTEKQRLLSSSLRIKVGCAVWFFRITLSQTVFCFLSWKQCILRHRQTNVCYLSEKQCMRRHRLEGSRRSAAPL